MKQLISDTMNNSQIIDDKNKNGGNSDAVTKKLINDTISNNIEVNCNDTTSTIPNNKTTSIVLNDEEDYD